MDSKKADDFKYIQNTQSDNMKNLEKTFLKK